MINVNLFHFGLDKISDANCKESSQIVLWLENQYNNDSEFRNIVDLFLMRFNRDLDDKMSVEDLVNLEFGKIISKEKIKIIKRFFDEVLGNFKIGITFNNLEFIGIDLTIHSTKNAVIKILGFNPENTGKALNLVKVILNFLDELKVKVNCLITGKKTKGKELKSIPSNGDELDSEKNNGEIHEDDIQSVNLIDKEGLGYYLRGLNAINQNDLLINFYNVAKKDIRYKYILNQATTFSSPIKNLLLTELNLELDDKKKKKLNQNLYNLLDSRKYIVKLQPETIDYLVMFLERNIEIVKKIGLEGFIKIEDVIVNQEEIVEENIEAMLLDVTFPFIEKYPGEDELILAIENYEIESMGEIEESKGGDILDKKIEGEEISGNTEGKIIESTIETEKTSVGEYGGGDFIAGIIDENEMVDILEISEPVIKELPENFEGEQINEEQKVGEKINKGDLLVLRKTIVNTIYVLNNDKQKRFFNKVFDYMINNKNYSSLRKRGVNKMHTYMPRFIGEGKSSFSNLIKTRNSKIGKHTLGKFIEKVSLDENLSLLVASMLDIDVKSFNLLKDNPINSKGKFFSLEEKERKKILLIKASVGNLFSGLDKERKKLFLLGIYKQIKGESIDIENPQNVYKLKDAINKLIKDKSGYITDLFFLKDVDNIKPRKFVDNLVFGLSKSEECIAYCIDLFGLESEIKKIYEDDDLVEKDDLKDGQEPIDKLSWVEDVGSEDRGDAFDPKYGDDDDLVEEDILLHEGQGEKTENEDMIGDLETTEIETIHGGEKLEKIDTTICINTEKLEIGENTGGVIFDKKIDAEGIKDSLESAGSDKNLDITPESLPPIKFDLLAKLKELQKDKPKTKKLKKNLKDFVPEELGVDEGLLGSIEELPDSLISSSIQIGNNKVRIERPLPKVDKRGFAVINEENMENNGGLNTNASTGEGLSGPITGPFLEKAGDLLLNAGSKLDEEKLGGEANPLSESNVNVIKSLDIALFLPLLNDIVIYRLKKKFPDSYMEKFKDYEFVEGHFTSISLENKGNVKTNMFSKIPKLTQNSPRFKRILTIISIEELNEFVNKYILNHKLRN